MRFRLRFLTSPSPQHHHKTLNTFKLSLFFQSPLSFPGSCLAISLQDYSGATFLVSLPSCSSITISSSHTARVIHGSSLFQSLEKLPGTSGTKLNSSSWHSKPLMNCPDNLSSLNPPHADLPCRSLSDSQDMPHASHIWALPLFPPLPPLLHMPESFGAIEGWFELHLSMEPSLIARPDPFSSSLILFSIAFLGL